LFSPGSNHRFQRVSNPCRCSENSIKTIPPLRQQLRGATEFDPKRCSDWVLRVIFPPLSRPAAGQKNAVFPVHNRALFYPRLLIFPQMPLFSPFFVHTRLWINCSFCG
jgi:hypothetical protein